MDNNGEAFATQQGYDSASSMPSQEGLPEGTAIYIDENGTYWWRREIDMWHDPTIMLIVGKALGIVLGLTFVVLMCAFIFAGHADMGGLLWVLPILLGIFALVAVVGALSYMLWAKMLGGTYIADFEIDEEGASHLPTAKEVKYTNAVATAAALSALIAGTWGTAVAASAAAAGQQARSTFKSVRQIKVDRAHNDIRLTEFMLFNHFYVAPQDLDFILNLFVERCPNAQLVDR